MQISYHHAALLLHSLMVYLRPHLPPTSLQIVSSSPLLTFPPLLVLQCSCSRVWALTLHFPWTILTIPGQQKQDLSPTLQTSTRNCLPGSYLDIPQVKLSVTEITHTVVPSPSNLLFPQCSLSQQMALLPNLLPKEQPGRLFSFPLPMHSVNCSFLPTLLALFYISQTP